MTKYSFFIFFILFILVNNQQCLFGKNCPYNQGFCIDTKCECVEGYWSLMKKELPPESQIFCNYEQYSLYLPLFLEFVIPLGLGHLFVGKYWFALVKLILGITSFLSGYYLTGKFEGPVLIRTLKNKLLGEEPIFEKTDVKKIFRGNRDLNKNNNRENEEENIPLKIKVVTIIYNCTFYSFWTMFVADLYFYYFKIYKDGNGVPFI